tara:strand:- start:658 stop:957 length:300 start_codon:yes stop_codon:yes gene_type:complete
MSDAQKTGNNNPTLYGLFGDFDPDELTLMVMDGYDDCIIGVVERFGQSPIVCYDKVKIIQKLESDGMDNEEAEEFFRFNQLGAGMGDLTPCFLSPTTNH